MLEIVYILFLSSFLRCKAPGFHDGEFRNGVRTCSSDCEENNVYGAYCTYSCNTGCRLVGPDRVTCLGTTWSAATPPVCQDIVPPTFPQGCVPDLEKIAAPVGQETIVSWTAPTALDNSGSPPKITYRLPGTTTQTSNTSAVFEKGIHQMIVYATDATGNTETCFFTVNITVMTCANPKEEFNVTYMIYRPDPYGRQPLGTVLSLSCDMGYPQHGAKQITCDMVPNTGNRLAKWTWIGDTVDMRPDCVVQPCPELTPPQNGALSCFSSTVGTDCLMSCNNRYDIPPYVQHVAGGRYSCVTSNTTFWFPAKVADCSEVVNPGHIYVQQEIFYYAGSCNDSIEDLQQAFVDRMKNNIWLTDACTTACVHENVQVFCGNTTKGSRKRRSNDQDYIKNTFDLLIQYSNATTPQELSTIQSKLKSRLREELTGNSSLVFEGLTTNENSVGSSRVGCQCPSGKICNDNLSCECPSFEKPENSKDPNLIISGKEINVTVECLPGFAWAMTYNSAFYCGPQTNFTWSQEPYLLVPFQPPFCSKIEAATGVSGQFLIPINHAFLANEAILTDLKQQVETSLSTLPCKNLQNMLNECTAAVVITCDKPKEKEEVTGNGTATVTRKKRSAEAAEKLTLVVSLSGEIANNTDLTPGTPAYNQYLAVMRAVEESTRKIIEEADQLFSLRVNGQDIHPDVANVFSTGSYHCPSGSAMRNAFCVKCPSGTYEQESQCVFCPMDQYQDETGQTSCKHCPPGTHTNTVGAYRLDQCIH